MISLPLIFFLIGHILAVFYLKKEPVEVKKSDSYLAILGHLGIYTAVMLLMNGVLFSLDSHTNWWGLGLILVGHAVIEIGKQLFRKIRGNKRSQDKWVYVCDQVMHLLLIFMASLLMANQGEIVDYEQGYLLTISKGLLYGLLLFKPTNVTFKILFAKYQYEGPDRTPTNDKEIKLAATVTGAGAVIGNLERVIMALFLLLNQYGAIGLILTAKSITRYNKIATNPAFSEYYLIGTLYSLLATLLPYLLLFYGHF